MICHCKLDFLDSDGHASKTPHVLPECLCSSQKFCRAASSSTRQVWQLCFFDHDLGYCFKLGDHTLTFAKSLARSAFRDKLLRHKLCQNASQRPDIFLVTGVARLKGLWTRVFWMRCELAFPECAAILVCTSHVISVCSKIDHRNCHMKTH